MSGIARTTRITDDARQHALSMAYICERRAFAYPASRAAEAGELRAEADGWLALSVGEMPESPTPEQLEWLELAGAHDIG